MKIEWKSCFRVSVSVVAVYLFIFYFENLQHLLVNAVGAAIPLFAGCVIAYIVNILLNFYERHFFPYTKKRFVQKIRRPICLLLAGVSLVGIVSLVISLLLPQLIDCIKLVSSQIPGAIERTLSFLEKLGIVPEKMMNDLALMDWNARMGEIIETVSAYFGNMVNIVFSVITRVFSVAVGVLLSVIFAFYLLLAKDRLSRQINSIIMWE